MSKFPKPLETFGGRLKSERQRLSLSQTTVARVAGITHAKQVAYEQSARLPNAEYISAVHTVGFDIWFVLMGVSHRRYASELMNWDLLEDVRAIIDEWCEARTIALPSQTRTQITRVIYDQCVLDNSLDLQSANRVLALVA